MTSETDARRSVAMTGAPRQPLDAGHRRLLPVETDVGAEPRELLHVHEAVLEDRLADLRLAVGPRHQRHELRLQVGGEAGERLGRDIDRPEPRAVPADADALVRLAHLDARRGERVERALRAGPAPRPAARTSPPAAATAMA